MNQHKVVRSACAFVATLMLCTPVQAVGLFRAYLASYGSDASPCNLSAPCRLLPAALNAVADGGEIWMLDSANFNNAQVNIAKSVTILAIPGALGSVVALGGGDAVNINTAGVNVTLRNLVIAPIAGGGGVNGIVMNNGATLSVENSVLFNFTGGHGVRVTAPATVRIVDTVIRNTSFGIWIQGGATASIAGTKVLGNGTIGLRANGNVGGLVTTVAVTDSVLTGHGFGVNAYADNATAVSRVSVIRSTITNSQEGVRSECFQGTVLVTVSDSMVTGNGTGLVQTPDPGCATLESLGNNTIRQNTNPTAGTITAVNPG